MNCRAWFLFSFIVLFISACSPGAIDIRRNSAENPQSPSSPTPQSVGSSNTPAIFNPLVYFARVTSLDSLSELPRQINGLGFLPAKSQVTTAFSIPMEFRSFFPDQASLFYAPTASGVAYLKERGNLDSIFMTLPATLESSALSAFSDMQNFSISSDGQSMSWVTSKGEAFFQKGASKNPFQVSSSTTKDLIVSRDGSELYYRSTVDIFTSPQNRSSWVEVLGFNSAGKLYSKVSLGLANGAFAISPSGNQVASVETGAGLPDRIIILDRSKNISRSLAISADRIFDISWKDDGKLSFWVETHGQQILETFDMQTLSVNQVSALSLPVAVSGIVCPTWIGGELYFANTLESTYAIYRAIQNSRGEWSVQPFAIAASDLDGYICPKSTAERVTK